MEILTQISDTLQKGNDKFIIELTNNAITENIDPKIILDEALIGGMNVIGEKFRDHEIFLPEVLLAARAMHASLDLLKPLFVEDSIPTLGKIVIGTVQGDLHDLGKNLVGIMLEGAGFQVIDLGKDVSPENFVETAESENAQVIGMSALLTTTMPVMKKVVELVKEKNMSDKIKIIVGGAPVSESFAKEIGADAYGFDAGYSIECVKKLLGV